MVDWQETFHATEHDIYGRCPLIVQLGRPSWVGSASSLDCKWSGERLRCGGTNQRYRASGAVDPTSPSPASPSGITAAWRWHREPESQVPVRPSGPADKRQNVAPPPPRAVYTATPEHLSGRCRIMFLGDTLYWPFLYFVVYPASDHSSSVRRL